MAIKNEYILNFKSKGVNKAKKDVDKLDKSTDKLSKTTDSKLTPALKASKVAFAALGAAMVAGAGYAIKTAAEFETLKTRLNTMYGSVQAGTKAFQTFNKIAATTPFALKSVVEAGASLKAFGVDAEKNIKGVADLAAFMGIDVVEAANAMGRAFAGGAGAADVLRDRGVLQLIKDFKGIDDLTKMTLPEFRLALEESMTNPTLGIAGATDALSETFQGSYSNMMDSVDRLAASMGDKLLPVMKEVTGFVKGIADEIGDSKSIYDEQIDSIKLQQTELRILNSTIQNSEVGTRIYNDTLNKLKRDYPDLLAGLNGHEINQQKINDAVEDAIPLLEDKIELLKLEAILEATRQQQIDTQKKLFKSQSDTASALVETEHALEKVFYQITDHLAGSESFDSMTKLGNIIEDIREASVKFAEDGNLEEYYQSQTQGIKQFIAEVQNLAEESGEQTLFQNIFASAFGVGGMIANLFTDAGAATVDYQLNLVELRGVFANLEGSYESLGLSTEQYEVVMKLLSDTIKGTEENIESLSGSISNTPKQTEVALTGFQKFAKGFGSIQKDLFAKDSELRNHVIDSMGAIALASTDNKADQLKVQKFMVGANVAKGVIDIWTEEGWDAISVAKKVALSGTLVARGVTQGKAIDEQIAAINATKGKLGATPTQTRFAQYGMNEVVDRATPIIAGEAGAELVQITPLEGANVDGPQGGGNIVITGNVLSRDFVQGELREEIIESIRQGYQFT